jgi:aspartyl-tRNA(Asn)/glutamyl-tRNA(Gln) amidotransferase subunit A
MTARATAYALDAVIGPEPTDLRALPMPDESWRDAVENLHAPRKVLWSPTLGYAVVDPEIRAICERAVAALADRGTEVIEVEAPFAEDPGVPWLQLSLLANLRVVRRLDPRGERWDQLDPALAGMMQWAEESTTPTTALEVMDLAHQLNVALVDLFHRAPLLLTPTVAGQTPVGSAPGLVAGVEDVSWVRFTYPFNLTRSPAGTVCAGLTDDGLPVGLQVVGPQHADVAVLRMLAVLEETLGPRPLCPFDA